MQSVKRVVFQSRFPLYFRVSSPRLLSNLNLFVSLSVSADLAHGDCTGNPVSIDRVPLSTIPASHSDASALYLSSLCQSHSGRTSSSCFSWKPNFLSLNDSFWFQFSLIASFSFVISYLLPFWGFSLISPCFRRFALFVSGLSRRRHTERLTEWLKNWIGGFWYASLIGGQALRYILPCTDFCVCYLLNVLRLLRYVLSDLLCYFVSLTGQNQWL